MTTLYRFSSKPSFFIKTTFYQKWALYNENDFPYLDFDDDGEGDF